MSLVRIQGKKDINKGTYYEFDPESEPLGEGGMGKVYRGKMISPNGTSEDVAIKFLFPDLDASIIDRARREAEIKTRHENLVEMKGFVVTETTNAMGQVVPHYHVVSELLVGVTLDEVMRGITTANSGEPIPYAQELYSMYKEEEGVGREKFAVTVIRKILSGIMALHDDGYIHRDIDPTNIMVTKDGKIKLIDFGIAKYITGLKTTDKHLTQAGVFMGKPNYASPELVIGDINHHNYTTDIYSLGILFFHLVVGHLPFTGTSTSILNAQLTKPVPVHEVINPFFAAVIEKATQKDQVKRYNTAVEFRVAVDNLPNHYGKRRRRPAIIAAIATVCIAIVGAIIYFLPHGDGPVPPPPPPSPVPVVEDSFKIVKDSLWANPASAKRMLPTLQRRAMSNIPEAFIFSRLYLKATRPNELRDSIVKMQSNLKGVIQQDNTKAHIFLSNVLDLNPKDYRALYEIGTDYYDERGVKMDLRMALKNFELSKKYALEAGDTVFVNNYVQPVLNNF